MNRPVHDQLIEILPKLKRFTLALTGSSVEADDLLQATCLRALENLDKWQAGTRLDSWMYRMAQNLYKNQLRHDHVKMRHLREAVDTVNGMTDGVAQAVHKDTLSHLSSHLADLPNDQRTVLLLVAVEGYGYAEAATILDIPIGTVTSRLARARSSLQASLAKKGSAHD